MTSVSIAWLSSSPRKRARQLFCTISQYKNPGQARGFGTNERWNVLLARNADCCRLLNCRSGHRDAAVHTLADLVVRTGSRGCGLRIAGDSDDVGTCELAEVDHVVARESTSGTERTVGRVAVTDLVDRADSCTREVAWERTVVVDGVLIYRVQDRVHVCSALCIACGTELLGRVDSHDNDGCQDGNDTDDEQKFDEGETLPLRRSLDGCHKKRMGGRRRK